jgi:hypothetical protein
VVNLDQYITLVDNTKISYFWYNSAEDPDIPSDDDYNLLGGKQIKLTSD